VGKPSPNIAKLIVDGELEEALKGWREELERIIGGAPRARSRLRHIRMHVEHLLQCTPNQEAQATLEVFLQLAPVKPLAEACS